jgi:PPM family protein phosphatase
MDIAGLSDIGCHRENNEDNYSYWEPDDDDSFQRKGRLLTVADGMGGHEGGQEASRLAIDTIEREYANQPGDNARAILLEAFLTAHRCIKDYADNHPQLHGMGTTCTAIALLGHDLYYAHVGDSRLYLGRDSKIYRLTRDQSYVGRLVDQGIISPEEAGTHPQRNILIGALGAGAETSPESPEQPIVLEKGDYLVLCTDGLWSLINEDEIKKIASAGTADQACELLVRMAKDRGAPDNVTVQIVRV